MGVVWGGGLRPEIPSSNDQIPKVTVPHVPDVPGDLLEGMSHGNTKATPKNTKLIHKSIKCFGGVPGFPAKVTVGPGFSRIEVALVGGTVGFKGSFDLFSEAERRASGRRGNVR
jgi:hypothetical protein